MSTLTEEMVLARTRSSSLTMVIGLNFWGSELRDVSILRKLPNVEKISLSVNRITSLVDVQFCNKLQELFVRKNNITNLNEICYLQNLVFLTNLWLAENPCAEIKGYRLAVIRALPKLLKLDDVEVTDSERADATRNGTVLVHPEEDKAETHLTESDDMSNDSQGYVSDSTRSHNDVYQVAHMYAKPPTSGSSSSSTPSTHTLHQNHDRGSPIRQYPRQDPEAEEDVYLRMKSAREPLPIGRSDSKEQEERYLRPKPSIPGPAYEMSRQRMATLPRPRRLVHEADEDMYLRMKSTREPLPLGRNDNEVFDEVHSSRSVRMDSELDDVPSCVLPRSTPTPESPRSVPHRSEMDLGDYQLRIGARPRCPLDAVSQRGGRQERQDDETESRYMPRGRCVVEDMMFNELLSHPERQQRVRQRPVELQRFIHPSFRAPLSSSLQAENTNIFTATLCLIRELELHDLELLALSVNCRIDELRFNEHRE